MKPKAVVLTKFFWPEGGGAELATYLIIKEILSKIFDVIVLSGTCKPQPDVYRFCKYYYWSLFNVKVKPVEWLKTITSIKIIKKLVRDVNLVYIPSHTLLPLSVIIKQINPSIKVILHLHNYQVLSYTSTFLMKTEPSLKMDIEVELLENKNLTRAIITGILHKINEVNLLALQHADHIICCSMRQLELLTQYIPWIANKTIVAYNPLPALPKIEKKLGDEPLLLYIGGESYIKGFMMLVKLMSYLKKLKVNLIACGFSRPLRVCLSNVKILGRIPHNKLAKFHEGAWALFFPSLSEEPLPYTVVESCLLKTVPISSKVGGIIELIGGILDKEGLLFDPLKEESMCKSLSNFLKLDRKQILEIGHKLRETTIKKIEYSKKRFAKLLEEFLCYG